MARYTHIQAKDLPRLFKHGKKQLIACSKGSYHGSGYMKTLAMIADRYAGEVDVLLGDQADFPVFAEMFSITSTPVFIQLENGREIDRILGEVSVDELAAFLDKNMSMRRPGN